jgi:hypothetical protein
MKSLMICLLVTLPLFAKAEDPKFSEGVAVTSLSAGTVYSSANALKYGDAERYIRVHRRTVLLWHKSGGHFSEKELDEAVSQFKRGDRAVIYQTVRNTQPATLVEFNKILKQKNISDLELRKQLKAALVKEVQQGRQIQNLGNITKEIRQNANKLKAVGILSAGMAVASTVGIVKIVSPSKDRLSNSDRSDSSKVDRTISSTVDRRTLSATNQ